ncbi:tetratricopeptide repeat protein [Waterburya agarophytonicola K14]|uniref:non-specific serine/threonine protein kinase n=1 Tax=Waterburya agarophytonicola KI4 TaxID=2874699 RepID=A0A964BUX0_9CYAN|nr:tetratricopeptide repeat protein [Waterburya agarophytonicola]MCC0178577.1 tetratricopeptide repeat protein [Waterburya agarophytonicola KI4]
MSDSDFTIPISQSENDRAESNAEYGYKVLKSGDVLNQRFHIVRELGSGGFATTYLAIDKQSETENRCAVKQLQPRFNSSSIWASAKERLATEAMVLQWLGKHDRIPDFIGHFEENKQFYLVLEFIEGEEFEQEVRRQTLNEAQIIQFLFDILESLESVHKQGIIHRDIKPSNLIRRKKDGKMILIDFGAVKEIGTMAFDVSKQQVQTQIIGTPGYMPPEQNNGKPVYSSDIYALGRTVIFGMTNKSPMEWEESESGGVSAWNKKIAISEAFLKIINRMTAVNTSERYSSATEVLQDLKPLNTIEQTIGDKYQIVKFLGGKREINSYVANSLLAEDKSRYYVAIIEPENSDSSLSEITNRIMIGLNNLSIIDNFNRTPKAVEYFIDRSRIYVVQEYIEGKNLAQIIEDQFILSEAEVIDILTDTAIALQPIHKQQIIHGNIKPSSLIKRQKDNKIALVDFGLVEEAIDLIPDSKTGYIPPEQIAGRATYVSDIYALGMTAIHVLTGTSPQKLEKNPRTGEIIWHRKARISPSFAKILDRMICLDKNQRYQSVQKVIKDLRKIKQKSKFKGFYKYLLVLPIVALGIAIAYSQWAQRVAILEFYQGDRFLKDQQYQQAIDYYNNGLNKLPNTKGQIRNFEPVWLKKAKAQRQLNQYEEALKTCSTALKYYQSPQLWNCKALTLYSLDRYDSAVKAYDSAIEIAPDDVWLWNNRGEAYARLQQTNQAIFDFQKAIDLAPAKSFVPWNNLGKLYYQQQDYPRAIEAYQEALKIKPDYLPALIGLGNVQKSSQLYDLAVESYDRALTVNPNYHEAWYGKGSVAEYLKQYRNARDYYQRASQLKPDWSAATDALERVNRKLGV